MFKTTVIAAAIALGATQAKAHPITPIEEAAAVTHAGEAFGHYLSAWVSQRVLAENLRSIFTEDAIVELKLGSRPYWSVSISGPNAIGEFVTDMSKLGGQWSFSAVRYFSTLDKDTVFAQFDSKASIDGRPVQQRNLVVIKLEGERIAHIRDLNGAPFIVQALAKGSLVAKAPLGDAPGQ